MEDNRPRGGKFHHKALQIAVLDLYSGKNTSDSMSVLSNQATAFI